MSSISSSPSKRFSVTEFSKLCEVGIIAPDERVELIDGRVYNMSPIGHRHEAVLARLLNAMRFLLTQNLIFFAKTSIHLDEFTQPLPDLAIMPRRADFYEGRWPSAKDVLLVAEIAEGSLRHDRDVKIPRYASAGIPEAWLVDLNSDTVTQYSEPSGSEYQSIHTFADGETLNPSQSTGLTMSVSDIFG